MCSWTRLERVPLLVDLEALKIHDGARLTLQMIRDHALGRRQRLRELLRELLLRRLPWLPYLDLVCSVGHKACNMRA